MGRKYFGTDGVRGLVGQAPITPDFVMKLGWAAGQVLACDTTSVNFYQLARSAIKARPDRKTIVTDTSNFPTDRYILQGLAKEFGLNLVMIENSSQSVEEPERITPEILAPYLNDDVALVTLEVIQYRSGARTDPPDSRPHPRGSGCQTTRNCWRCSLAQSCAAPRTSAWQKPRSLLLS